MDPTDPTDQNNPQNGQQNNQPEPNPAGSINPESSNPGSAPTSPSISNPEFSTPPTTNPIDNPATIDPPANIDPDPITPADPPDPPTATSEIPTVPTGATQNTGEAPPTTYAGPSASGNDPDPMPTSAPDPVTNQTAPIEPVQPEPIPGSNLASTVQDTQAISNPPTAGEQGESMGPSWMRSDPSAPIQDQAVATPDLAGTNPAPSLSEAPPPWQTPPEAEGTPATPAEIQTEEKQGGFPVIIFIVLILGIIIAIVAFLFTQGALPFVG